MIDCSGTLSARALQGLRASLKGVACLLATVIGISLSLPMQVADGGSILATKTPRELVTFIANKQLTHKQYKCHQEIVFRESSWNHKAIGNIGGTKQTYGLYQLKINSMRNAHVEVQFWKYWDYVSYRYGITEYDEPMYCKALDHLITVGWQ
jgi:hypothetical protein